MDDSHRFLPMSAQYELEVQCITVTPKAARVNAGLTQTEAAKLLGVSTGTLAAIEKGIRTPDLSMMRAMQKLYGKPYYLIKFD